MKLGTMFQLQPLSLGFTDHSHTSMMMDEDTEEMSQSDMMGQHETLENNNSVRKAEIRKSNKPIMEKKRRARINHCLNDLKGILLEAMRKDPARHSKLEKADILELTVRHLQNVQRNQLAIAMATDPTVLHRFKNGFAECLTEVNRYMGKLDGVDQGIRQRLTGHLSTCVSGLQQVNPAAAFGGQLPSQPPAAPPIPPTHYTPIIVGPGNLNHASTMSFQQPHQQQQLLQLPTTKAAVGDSLPQRALQQAMSIISQDLNNNTSHNRHHSPVINTIPSITRHFSSPFSSVATPAVNKRSMIHRASSPPPNPNPLLISPPRSSESSGTCDESTPNMNNVSISSGSDISICTGSEKGTNTSPNSFALAAAAASSNVISDAHSTGSSPIDFSLKFKEKSSAARVLKVEPMMMMMFDNMAMAGRDNGCVINNSATTAIHSTKDSMWRPW